MHAKIDQNHRFSGMRGLTVVLIGQAVSILASSMTGFALSVWVFQQTSSATTLGIMQTAFTLPYLLIIPLAGVMVDRYNRKLMMMVSDLAAGLGTVAILFLLVSGHLQVWHFYVVNALIGLGNAFQWPAYSAAISTMVPKEQYGRANGMVSFVQAGPGAVAPLLAGALLPFIGLEGILTIDIVTFVLAVGVLLIVHVPQPIRTEDGRAAEGNLLHEAAFGFKYIFKRPSLFGYVILLFIANFFLGFSNSVEIPIVLLRTGNNSLILGTVQTAGAISWTLGSLIMSVWGGPKRRMHGALFGWIAYCLIGNVIFGLGRGLSVWVPAILLAGIGSSIGTATSQAILQAKVAPDVQGRVFAARRMLTWFPDTFTPILGGLLTDYVMEPGMREGGFFADIFGWMAGNEAGSGAAVIMVVFGLLTILTMLTGFSIPKIRNLEDILPDHEQTVPAAESAPAAE
ncbi:MAG: MFS transporter [Anaerolineaceae bacterium]|nr:MFS transporter [Anaerolineaceae bacterium]